MTRAQALWQRYADLCTDGLHHDCDPDVCAALRAIQPDMEIIRLEQEHRIDGLTGQPIHAEADEWEAFVAGHREVAE